MPVIHKTNEMPPIPPDGVTEGETTNNALFNTCIHSSRLCLLGDTMYTTQNKNGSCILIGNTSG